MTFTFMNFLHFFLQNATFGVCGGAATPDVVEVLAAMPL